MEKLSQKEIDRRMIELYNYRRLYPELRRNYDQAKQRIRELEKELARERQEREASVEALKLQIEELREMVFGRKRGGGDDDQQTPNRSSDEEKSKQKEPRSSASYRRPTPKEEEVTEEKHYGIDACPACGDALTNLHEAVRYLEDIVIPALSGLKIVTKQTIETGFCPHCRKWRSAIPIRKQTCSLGESVRMRIAYCITVLGQTFEKIARDLKDTFAITVSDGEIAHILTTEAAKLLPEYHDIDIRIREDPCRHGDETSWPVQQEGEGQWAWVKTASKTPDTIFRIGRSRGKGNAAELFPGNQPTITDDYAAYDDLPNHGLCWAHPKRKFQDLAESTTLAPKRKGHCQKFYKRFRLLFRNVKTMHEAPYDRTTRMKGAEIFRAEISCLCSPHPVDPKKLATQKATLLQNTEKFLFCLREPNIPMTNNKAERSIRPLVIKRKLSFGSKTQKGADVMSILLSVCLTMWWRKPKNFYVAYQAIVQKWQAA
jgi:transposase